MKDYEKDEFVPRLNALMYYCINYDKGKDCLDDLMRELFNCIVVTGLRERYKRIMGDDGYPWIVGDILQ